MAVNNVEFDIYLIEGVGIHGGNVYYTNDGESELPFTSAPRWAKQFHYKQHAENTADILRKKIEQSDIYEVEDITVIRCSVQQIT